VKGLPILSDINTGAIQWRPFSEALRHAQRPRFRILLLESPPFRNR